MNKKTAAYRAVCVTPEMQEDFTARIYPAVERTAWNWFKFHCNQTGVDYENQRGDCLALAWQLYLSDRAQGIAQPSPGAIASYARRQVWAGGTFCHPGYRNGHSTVDLHYIDPARLYGAKALSTPATID